MNREPRQNLIQYRYKNLFLECWRNCFANSNLFSPSTLFGNPAYSNNYPMSDHVFGFNIRMMISVTLTMTWLLVWVFWKNFDLLFHTQKHVRGVEQNQERNWLWGHRRVVRVVGADRKAMVPQITTAVVNRTQYQNESSRTRLGCGKKGNRQGERAAVKSAEWWDAVMST